MKHGKTESFQEALDLFNSVPHIVRDVDVAREIADELIRKHGSTDAKEVKKVMVERDLISLCAKHHWMGSLFHDKKKYEKTGELIKANGHDALANRWRFRNDPAKA
jgi:hypothetical protein